MVEQREVRDRLGWEPGRQGNLPSSPQNQHRCSTYQAPGVYFLNELIGIPAAHQQIKRYQTSNFIQTTESLAQEWSWIQSRGSVCDALALVGLLAFL